MKSKYKFGLAGLVTLFITAGLFIALPLIWATRTGDEPLEKKPTTIQVTGQIDDGKGEKAVTQPEAATTNAAAQLATSQPAEQADTIPAGAAPPPAVTEETKEANLAGWFILVIIAAMVLMVVYRMTKGKAAGKAVGGLKGATEKLFSAAWWQKSWWLLTLGGYLLILVCIWHILPSFWRGLTDQGKLFTSLVLLGVPVTIALVFAKQKFAWAFTFVWLTIIFLAVDLDKWPPARYWRLPLAEAKQKTAADEVKAKEMAVRGAENVRAKVETSTLVLKAGATTLIAEPRKWSRWFMIPGGHHFITDPEKDVEFQRLSDGEIIVDGPDRIVKWGYNLAPAMRTFRIQAPGDESVKVVIECHRPG